MKAHKIILSIFTILLAVPIHSQVPPIEAGEGVKWFSSLSKDKQVELLRSKLQEQNFAPVILIKHTMRSFPSKKSKTCLFTFWNRTEKTLLRFTFSVLLIKENGVPFHLPHTVDGRFYHTVDAFDHPIGPQVLQEYELEFKSKTFTPVFGITDFQLHEYTFKE